jgi:hypothetical protein
MACFCHPATPQQLLRYFRAIIIQRSSLAISYGPVASDGMGTTTMTRILKSDWEVYGSTMEQRSYYKNMDLEPPVDDIVGLVRQAVMEGERNVYTSF